MVPTAPCPPSRPPTTSATSLCGLLLGRVANRAPTGIGSYPEWVVCFDFLIFVVRTVSRAPRGIFSGGMSEVFLTAPAQMPLVSFCILSSMDVSFASGIALKLQQNMCQESPLFNNCLILQIVFLLRGRRLGVGFGGYVDLYNTGESKLFNFEKLFFIWTNCTSHHKPYD